MKIPIHRETFRIVLCLLLGVVTTVAVAWGCATWSGFEKIPLSALDPRHELIARDIKVSSGDSFGMFGVRGTGLQITELTAYGRERYAAWFCITRAGWPYHSLGAEYAGIGTPENDIYESFTLIGGIDLPEWLREPDRTFSYVLPYRPIFPGFIINTLFYAVIWFGLFFGIGATRKAIRKRRGRCEKCGYDLRGTPDDVGGPGGGCSECGWGREGSVACNAVKDLWFEFCGECALLLVWRVGFWAVSADSGSSCAAMSGRVWLLGAA